MTFNELLPRLTAEDKVAAFDAVAENHKAQYGEFEVTTKDAAGLWLFDALVPIAERLGPDISPAACVGPWHLVFDGWASECGVNFSPNDRAQTWNGFTSYETAAQAAGLVRTLLRFVQCVAIAKPDNLKHLTPLRLFDWLVDMTLLKPGEGQRIHEQLHAEGVVGDQVEAPF